MPKGRTLSKPERLNLPILGMHCANCALAVERSLGEAEGVSQATVSYVAEAAAVTFDPAVISPTDLVGRVKSTGYEVPTARVELAVTGMTCANCAATIERTLKKKVPGVTSAIVNFATETASVSYIPGMVGRRDMVAAIERAGYGVIDTEAGAAAGS